MNNKLHSSPCSIPEYNYDANGNLTEDKNKGIFGILYNTMNLPISIQKYDGLRLEYIYDATGTKRRQNLYTGMSTISKTTDFIGNIVYENGVPAYVNFGEGRMVLKTNGTWFAEIYLKDHLGNIRVAFSRENGLIKTRQVNSYYPFGMNIKELSLNSTDNYKANEYLYNGKMMQDEMGLGWLDYGARFYDAVLGRWHSVDPLAEKHFDFSPYDYVFNNPIKCIDPDGKDGIVVVDKANKVLIVRAIYYVPTTKIKGGYNGPLYKAGEVEQLNSSINATLNKKNYSVTEGEFNGYSLKFDLQFKEGGDLFETYRKLGSDNIEGHPISNTFEQGNSEQYARFKEKDKGDGRVFFDGGFTSNQNQIVMNSSADNKRNRVHEIFHTLFFNRDNADKGIGSYEKSDMPNQEDINALINNPNLPKTEQKKDEKKN